MPTDRRKVPREEAWDRSRNQKEQGKRGKKEKEGERGRKREKEGERVEEGASLESEASPKIHYL